MFGTYDSEQIHISQWKTNMIVVTVVRTELSIPKGGAHHTTFIEYDWELPGCVARNKLQSRNIYIFSIYPD